MTVSDQQWSELSREEKRQQRFNKWLSPPGVSFDNAAAAQAYQEKVTRFINAITLQQCDRVPVILPIGSFPAHYAGTTLKNLIYDHDELRRVWYKFIDEFELDTFHGPALITAGKVMEIVDLKTQKWPGRGLGDEVSMSQFVENEYMTAGEYDALIDNPLDFYLRCYLPRAWGVLEPLRKIGQNLDIHDIGYHLLSLCGDPEIRSAFATVGKAAELYKQRRGVVAEISGRILAAGIPNIRGMMTSAPFDYLGDLLRGTKGIAMDMYRCPDKLLETMEALTPRLLKRVLTHAETSACPVVFMPLHKGDDTFMSEQQFKTFYWPYLQQLLLGLIEEGLTPYLFAEGKYSNRLELIKDLPQATTIWHFDQTNMYRAKEVLGGTACIAGNIPSSLLYTGTPEIIKENCFQLIEGCGKGGGFILAGGATIDKGNPDNIRAMSEAAREYRAAIPV
jgi:hypothetical protein